MRFSQRLLQKDYLGLDRDLAAAPYDASPLARGILASRKGDSARCIERLGPLLDSDAAIEPVLLTMTHEALANALVSQGAYAAAAEVWDRLLKRWGGLIDPLDREDAEGSRSFVAALRGAPVQTLDAPAGFTLPIARNGVGLLEVEVTSGDLQRPWIVDTGANFCLLTEPLAKAAGVERVEGEAWVVRSGGVRVRVRIGILPRLRLGPASLRNVVVIVAAEEDFHIPQLSYSIGAVLGHPVLSALSPLTFAQGRLIVGVPAPPPAGETSIWLEGLTPLLALESGGSRGLYVIDLGARRSYLTQKALAAQAAPESRDGEMIFGGAGDERRVPAMKTDIQFAVGGAAVTLRGIPVALQSAGATADAFFGLVGQDFLQLFSSYTIDFRAMTFSVAFARDASGDQPQA